MDLARRLAIEVAWMVLAGGLAGIGLGLTAARYIETLLYEVKPEGFPMLAIPAAAILLVAVFASIPAVARALRIDPASLLRAE